MKGEKHKIFPTRNICGYGIQCIVIIIASHQEVGSG